MSVEAMWSVCFIASNQSWGSGVVVLESGRVFGGDSSFIYLGDYSCRDGNLTANVRVRRHHFTEPQQPNIVGLDDFTVSLEGEWDHDRFTLKTTNKSPDFKIEVRFKREEELP